MLAKMTLWGLESFMQSEGRSIFDDIVIPEQLDKQTLIDSIFLRANEFPVLYTDTDYLHYMTQAWFKKYQDTFEKWVYAMELEYNPIFNYDRFEEINDNGYTNRSTNSNKIDSMERSRELDEDTKRTLRGDTSDIEHGTNSLNARENVETTDNSTETGNKGTVESTTGTIDTTETAKKAVTNNSNWNNYEQTVTDSDTSESVTSSETDNITRNDRGTGSTQRNESASDERARTGQNNESETTGRGEHETENAGNTSRLTGIENTSDNRDHIGHIWGNIGVTTSTAILVEYMKARKEFNLYDLISELYVKDFCLMIY